jgi:tetratricopeptide (TPR) repeat protein
MYQRALASHEKTYGTETLTVQLLAIVNNHSNFYRKQGRSDEAEGMFWRALAGREKVHGNEALTIPLLDSIYNLGLLYHEQRRLEEAEGMHKRAPAGFQEMYGPSHKKLRYSPVSVEATDQLAQHSTCRADEPTSRILTESGDHEIDAAPTINPSFRSTKHTRRESS